MPVVNVNNENSLPVELWHGSVCQEMKNDKLIILVIIYVVLSITCGLEELFVECHLLSMLFPPTENKGFSKTEKVLLKRKAKLQIG